MERQTIRDVYMDFFKSLMQNSVAAANIDESNVYQPANLSNRKMMYKLVEDWLGEGSGLGNIENFEKFYDLLMSGKSGLILMEHYSNTDLPELFYLLEKSGNPKLLDLSKRLVAIAGMKLNEDNPVVRGFAESFTRVVIYPTRSLEKKSEEEMAQEKVKANKINMAAMHAMHDCKNRGEAILVFPSGTRYRPGHPETKRGLREIDSYLRLFDVAIFVSINGSILEIQEGKEDMLSDYLVKDKVVLTASPIIELKKFRKDFMASLPADTPDPKQCMIDRVMEMLDEQHDEVEKTRR